MSSYAERFRPTPLAEIKERTREVAELTNQYENDNDSERLKRMQIKADGTYIVRIYPSHPVDGAISIEAKTVYWLPAMVNKKEDGKYVKDKDDKFIKVKGKRPFFDAKVHGGAQYDLVDTYISLVKKKADELYPDKSQEDDKKTYLIPLLGSYASGSQYQGIMPKRSFLFYGELLKNGEDQGDFYEFEVTPAVKKQIEKAAAFENNDEPLGTDGCFTDPIDGLPAKIVVNSEAGKKDPAAWYTANIYKETIKQNVNGKLMSVIRQYPISDEKLKWFDENVEPLVNYRKVFKHSDLKLQLEGLEMFDSEIGYDVINSDEFKEVYNYLDKKFPAPEESDDTDDSSNDYKIQKSDDELDLMDLKELKQYIKDNKLSIVVLPRYSAEELRQIIREYESGDVDDSADHEGEDNVSDYETEQIEQESVSKTSSSTDLDAKLSEIRKKFSGN